MKLSIVIPCYNESKDIAKNCEIIKKHLEDIKQDYELILVNDGSKDNTKEVIMDADLSTDLSAIEKFLKLAPDYDMVIGSRHAKDSVIKKKQPALRVFIGWCCRRLVNMKFHFKFKDTQCGFKAMRTDIAKKIVSKQVVNNFAFDVEYLYIASLNNLSIYEMGVIWADDRGSTVSPLKSSIKFFKDLSFIKKHKKTYLFDNQIEK